MKKVYVFMIALILCMLVPGEKALAADRKVGVLVGDSQGNYSWYDLNESEERSKNVVKYSENGTVMLPVYQMASLMGDIKYSYDSKTKQVTVSNQKNGRKIVGNVNSTSLTCYTKSNTKGTSITMKCRIYIAKGSGVMIPADALKYVMYSKGYSYENAESMKGYGYDCITYEGIYIYNASAPVSGLPKATTVNGLSNTVRVTIPEGYSVAQIFNLLVDKGVCESVDGLFDACQNYSFNYERYPFLVELDKDTNRCFRLEGYLYPDTYDFYRLCPPQDAIGVCMRNTKTKITDEMTARASELNMTMDQILTLASIIEKEGASASDKKMISSVLYNRLAAKMKFQVDATSYYVERYVKPYITGDINRYNELYNTYKCSALPASPICNPGKNSILAALYPEESNYLFFCSDEEGTYYFSETWEEHKATLVNLEEN